MPTSSPSEHPRSTNLSDDSKEFAIVNAGVDAGWCTNREIGVYLDPTDGNKFYRCAKTAIHVRCPEKMVFGEECKCCTWPQFKDIRQSDWCSSKPDGFYSDRHNKSKFYICARHQTFWRDCPTGLVFYDACKCCNWPMHKIAG